MDNVKKFKNGNIVIKIEDLQNFDVDAFYHGEMFWNDLYFNQINGYMYLVDYNTQRVYDFSDCYINILIHLKENIIKENGKLKIYPVSKKEGKQLFKDLENGY